MNEHVDDVDDDLMMTMMMHMIMIMRSISIFILMYRIIFEMIQMYQRSADMGLGVPFNIASYALLTRLVAQVCGLRAGDFVHTIGDAHIYLNHVDALREQLQREPRHFPTLTINPAVNDIDGFSFSDFNIESYEPHSTIKMAMAV